MNNNRKICFDCAKRVVVKVGSNVLTENHGLNVTAIRSVTRQICRLIDRGLEVILVTSGAMASGVKKVGLSKRPDEIPKRQAVAAVGQAGLIMPKCSVPGSAMPWKPCWCTNRLHRIF